MNIKNNLTCCSFSSRTLHHMSTFFQPFLSLYELRKISTSISSCLMMVNTSFRFLVESNPGNILLTGKSTAFQTTPWKICWRSVLHGLTGIYSKFTELYSSPTFRWLSSVYPQSRASISFQWITRLSIAESHNILLNPQAFHNSLLYKRARPSPQFFYARSTTQRDGVNFGAVPFLSLGPWHYEAHTENGNEMGFG